MEKNRRLIAMTELKKTFFFLERVFSIPLLRECKAAWLDNMFYPIQDGHKLAEGWVNTAFSLDLRHAAFSFSPVEKNAMITSSHIIPGITLAQLFFSHQGLHQPSFPADLFRRRYFWPLPNQSLRNAGEYV